VARRTRGQTWLAFVWPCVRLEGSEASGMSEEPPRSRRVTAGERAGAAGPVLTRHIGRVAAIFDVAPIAVGVWSLDGRLVHANPVLCDLLGARRADLVGTHLSELIDPADAPGVRLSIDDLWRGDRNHFVCHILSRGSDGASVRLTATVTPVYGGEGRPEYLISQIFDFGAPSEQATTTERLSNDVPAMLWLTDERGLARVGNRMTYAFLGQSPLSGDVRKGFFEHLHADDFAAAADELHDRLVQRTPIEFVARSRRHDGEWRWILNRALPVFAGDGHFEGYAGASLDITERENHRRELLEFRRLFRSITESGPLAVARLDVDGQITYMNERWAEVLDDPESQMQGLNWQQLLGEEEVGRIIELGLESVETGEGFKLRVSASGTAQVAPDHAPHLAGERYWAELRVVPVYDDEDRPDGWVATLTDVSGEVAAGSRADRLARVLDAGSDFLMIAERNGVISYVNNAANTVLGVDAADSTDAPNFLMDVLDAESYERFQDIVEPLLATEGIWRGELAFRAASGTVIPVSALFLAHFNEHGHVESVSAVARDISDLKAAQGKLHELATHDYLTGMPNRILLYDRLEHALARFERYGQPLALLFLDLDRFKPVNDEYGHHMGDKVLQRIADRILAVIRDTDTAARIGGDEFCLLVEGMDDIELLKGIADRLIQTISEPVEVGGARAQIGASIGLVAVDERNADADVLMALADKAMYRAKAEGRGRCVVYDPRTAS
jgi:diguanylate cyclase (GGDEF)-like protein/PAS domain S-box-containing protein